MSIFMSLASYKSNVDWIYKFNHQPHHQCLSSVHLHYLRVHAVNSSKDCSRWLLEYWNTCRTYCMLCLICCMCISGKHMDFLCSKNSITDSSPQLVRAECSWVGEQDGEFGPDEEASIRTQLDQGLGDLDLVLLSRCKFEIEHAAHADGMPQRLVADRPSWTILLYYGLF